MVYFLEFCEKEFKLVNLEYLSQIKRFHKILQREFFYVKRLLKLIRIQKYKNNFKPRTGFENDYKSQNKKKTTI